jgi:hypothetical protein
MAVKLIRNEKSVAVSNIVVAAVCLTQTNRASTK